MSEHQLIELVKQYPVLYDRDNEQYGGYKTRNAAWEEIAQRINIPVKQYPVLYDRDNEQYGGYKTRNAAWEEIAQRINIPVDEVKTKWEKLRNCYTNALKRRRKKDIQGATDIVSWKHEKRMKFLLPHLKWKSSMHITNEDLSYIDEFPERPGFLHTYIDYSAVKEPSSRSSTPSLRETKQEDNENNLIGEMLDILKSSSIKQEKSTDMDENDYFFLSMSKLIKKLPRSDQSEIKFKLHQLIHEAEIKMLKNHMNPENLDR